MQNSQINKPDSVLSKKNQEVIHLMVSIDTTQEKIVEASAKIIKMAIAKPETSFQQEVVQVWQSLVEQHDKPLPLVYLANDLIQRSKIKGTTEFWTLFKPALALVF